MIIVIVNSVETTRKTATSEEVAALFLILKFEKMHFF